MTDRSRSPKDFIAQVKDEVTKLPPGSDVAEFITRRNQELQALFAEEVARAREDASQEADFSPSGMPPLRMPDDEAGEDAPSKDGPAS